MTVRSLRSGLLEANLDTLVLDSHLRLMKCIFDRLLYGCPAGQEARPLSRTDVDMMRKLTLDITESCVLLTSRMETLTNTDSSSKPSGLTENSERSISLPPSLLMSSMTASGEPGRSSSKNTSIPDPTGGNCPSGTIQSQGYGGEPRWSVDTGGWEDGIFDPSD